MAKHQVTEQPTPWLGHLRADLVLSGLGSILVLLLTGDLGRAILVFVLFIPVGYVILAGGWWLQNRRRKSSAGQNEGSEE